MTLSIKKINFIREQRGKRSRAKFSGTAEIPRFCVSISNKYIYAQLIDDDNGVTLASSFSKSANISNNIESANKIGKEIAEKAKELKISKAVFDRGNRKFHGVIKEVAESARKNGLTI